MVKQFSVILMNANGLKEFLINCADKFSARIIAEAIHHNYRVIDVVEK